MRVPKHGAKISARAPTKGYVQTGARDLAQAQSLNGALMYHDFPAPQPCCGSHLKVFKAWVRGFFQGKMFIRNISAYKDVIETKFGTWTDFTVRNIFK